MQGVSQALWQTLIDGSWFNIKHFFLYERRFDLFTTEKYVHIVFDYGYSNGNNRQAREYQPAHSL